MSLTLAYLTAFFGFIFCLVSQYIVFLRQQKFQREMQKEQQDFQERMQGAQMQWQKMLFDADSIGRTQAAEHQQRVDAIREAERRAFEVNLAKGIYH